MIPKKMGRGCMIFGKMGRGCMHRVPNTLPQWGVGARFPGVQNFLQNTVTGFKDLALY